MRLIKISIAAVLLLGLILGISIVVLGRSDNGPIHPLFGLLNHFFSDEEAMESAISTELTDAEALADRRKFVDRFYKLAMPTTFSGEITDARIDTGDRHIPVRVYRPPDAENLPVLLYFFGGGWIYGSIDAVDGVAKYISQRAQVVVVSVGYRLAPEHPFPAAIDDAYSALLWAQANATMFGGDPNKLAVAGDSAGGNISAVLTLLTRDRKGPKIGYQGLIYPVTNAQSQASDAGEPRAMLRAYAPGQDLANPYLSPLLADSHEGLPPGIVITAQHDELLQEGKAYAEKLKAAGVDIEYVNFDTMGHGFISMIGVVSAANEALDKIAVGIRKAFPAL
ncbi:MAG: alpha/beta hydrolase [Pseudomonadales bacterium]